MVAEPNEARPKLDSVIMRGIGFVILPQAPASLSQKDVSPPKALADWFSSLMVLRLKSFNLFPGEFKLGSGEVPIDDEG